jgi:hypothetical protein
MRLTRESFEAGMNRRVNRPAEMIAKFIDVRLKAGDKANKGRTPAEVEEDIRQAMILFRAVQGKGTPSRPSTCKRGISIPYPVIRPPPRP